MITFLDDRDKAEIEETMTGYVQSVIGILELNWTDGGYVSKDDGAVYEEIGSSYSNFVSVEPGDRLIISNTMTSDTEWNAFYDANETFKSSFSNASGTIVVPNGVYKMRLSKYTSASIVIVSEVSERIQRNKDSIDELKGDLGQLSEEIANLPGTSDEQVQNAVDNYMANNPIEESDPTVPDWAKQPQKPTYTASEVGAEAAGTAESKVSEHNVSDTAHNDIRLLVQGLTERLNALADSDDETLDQMSEVVAYIKSNKNLIDAITTSKINVSDIIDNLTTNVSNKPLSAAQGVALKKLIDAITSVELDETLTDNTKAAPSGMVGKLKGEITDKATLENRVIKFWKTSTEENRTDTLLYSVDISSIGGTGGSTVYGFHVNSNESDPSACVTYLRDAVGMTPAKMDFTNGKFDWGSWRDAFFIPKPCMLRSDGTVAYYLNENNYALKEDGTASDISNDSFDGNAMMEWGKDHKRIWYKIVADANDATSYSVYIADHKEDKNYVAWSFYNKNDELMEHFYTPIYSGSLDSNNKLRSLSGKSIMQSRTGTEEISYAKANGDGWNIEVWADKLLMFLLLYLMGKSLDVQGTYGQGHSTDNTLINTGTLDDKGLFFGYSDTYKKVKVFGMEDQWAEQMNRCCGLILDNGIYKYKLTEGTADGSTVNGYPTDNTNGMLDGGQSPTANGYVNKFAVTGDTILPNSVSGGSSTYYCDYFYQRQSGVMFAFVGGSSIYGDNCGFFVVLDGEVGVSAWFLGCALSCKPLAW